MTKKNSTRSTTPAAGLLAAIRGAKTHLGFVSTLRTIIGCRDQDYAGELFDGLANLLPELEGITQALVSDAMYRMIWDGMPGPCPSLPGVSVAHYDVEKNEDGAKDRDRDEFIEMMNAADAVDREPVRFDKPAPAGPEMYGIDEDDYLTGDGLDDDLDDFEDDVVENGDE